MIVAPQEDGSIRQPNLRHRLVDHDPEIDLDPRAGLVHARVGALLQGIRLARDQLEEVEDAGRLSVEQPLTGKLRM